MRTRHYYAIKPEGSSTEEIQGVEDRSKFEVICFVNAAVAIHDPARQHRLTDEEVAFLLSADPDSVRQILNFDWPPGLELSDIEAMGDRMSRISAHDRMRLAAFRAETEQIPSDSDPIQAPAQT